MRSCSLQLERRFQKAFWYGSLQQDLTIKLHCGVLLHWPWKNPASRPWESSQSISGGLYSLKFLSWHFIKNDRLIQLNYLQRCNQLAVLFCLINRRCRLRMLWTGLMDDKIEICNHKGYTVYSWFLFICPGLSVSLHSYERSYSMVRLHY